MAKPRELEYGFADRAWQVVTGCDNTISCWKRCWAARTVNRLAASPNAKVAAAHDGLVRIAGPVDKQVLAWTGVVRINEAHLNDPRKWRNPAIIATGFHGDWGLLSDADKDRMFAVMARCQQHTFFPLTKHRLPDLARYLWAKHGHFSLEYEPGCSVSRLLPFDNVNIGVSVMAQADADFALPHIRAIAAMGWKVHCWHEPATGPIDWDGWQFLSLLIQGGESGPSARPMHPQWARDTRDWCVKNSVAYRFKQWGEWTPRAPGYPGHQPTMRLTALGRNGQNLANSGDGNDVWMQRTGKKLAGHLLDGQEWKQMPGCADKKPCPGCGQVDRSRKADEVCSACSAAIQGWDTHVESLRVQATAGECDVEAGTLPCAHVCAQER
jgi:protein gp37